MMLCEMGWKIGMGGGMGMGSVALLLIALGVGALVKYKALKASECQKSGQMLGYFIMIVAALGLVLSAVGGYKRTMGCCDSKMGCDRDKVMDSGSDK